MLMTSELLELLIEETTAHASFAKSVSVAATQRDRQLRDISHRKAQVRAAAGDLPVLLRRTPGSTLSSYHSQTDPCGRVTGTGRNVDSFERSTERAVLDRQPWLTRCTACRWRRASERIAP